MSPHEEHAIGEARQQHALAMAKLRAHWTKVNVNAASEVLAEMKAAGKTSPQILANIKGWMTAMQGRTGTNLPAQEKRQLATSGLRAGGAPNTKHAAAMQVQALLDQFQAGGNPNQWDKQTARNRLGQLAQAMQEANQNIKGKLVINFHSGGPFLYPSIEGPSSFATLLAAGSAGRCVWHSLRLGPDSHPTYNRVDMNPERIISQKFVSSTWVIFFALYEM
jgi:hypothetical protein